MTLVVGSSHMASEFISALRFAVMIGTVYLFFHQFNRLFYFVTTADDDEF